MSYERHMAHSSSLAVIHRGEPVNEPGSPRGKSWTGGIAAVALLLTFAALAWWGIATRTKAMVALERDTVELAMPSVTVVQPRPGAPQREVVLPGTMQAHAEAPIYARTSGYLKRRLVDIGARVNANQLLAEIDAPELEQQLQQARADLSTAEANARLAQVTWDRYADLIKTDSVSQQDVDNAAGTLEARKTAVQSARHNVQRLEQLKGYTQILAPFAGTITARNTDVGALIDPGASGGPARALFQIASTDTLRVYVNVPQPYSRAAQPGLPVDLTLAEFPSRRFAGRLVRTSGAIDPASRTLLAELEVANPKGELLPGAYAQVHLKLPTPEASLILPVNTLMFRSDGLRVAVVGEGDHVRLAPVSLGRDFGTEAEIATGLSGGERVVTSPPDSLTDGQVVRIVAARQPSGANGATVPGGAREAGR
jgi:RND family efflux transporter MFP subunit